MLIPTTVRCGRKEMEERLIVSSLMADKIKKVMEMKMEIGIEKEIFNGN